MFSHQKKMKSAMDILKKNPRSAAIIGGIAGLGYMMYSNTTLNADNPAAVPYEYPWSHKGPFDAYDAARYVVVYPMCVCMYLSYD
jgi:hypothetical protein